MTRIETAVDEITDELLRYCGPIFVAPALDSFPEQMIGSGTYALIDTGQKRLLVTCCHVWDKYLEQHDANPETILAVALGEGNSVIAFKNPEVHKIAINRDLDIAVFEFERTEFVFSTEKSGSRCQTGQFLRWRTENTS